MPVFLVKKNPKNKFGAKKTIVDGILFASTMQARDYGLLKFREKAGEVSNIRLEVVFKITIGGVLICKYIADFVYNDLLLGKEIVYDTKGVITPIFSLKKKLMKAVYGIDITVTPKPKKRK